jgi:hypothetical protein
LRDGSIKAAKIAIIAITTSNSINENAQNEAARGETANIEHFARTDCLIK